MQVASREARAHAMERLSAPGDTASRRPGAGVPAWALTCSSCVHGRGKETFQRRPGPLGVGVL